jgi:hypothetical protein
VNTGIASDGNAVTLPSAVQPLLQLTVTLDPTVNTPALETYTRANPLPAEIVAVAPVANEYTRLPNRTWQGVVVEQLAPMDSVVALVHVTAKSPNWVAIDAAGGPCSKLHEFVAVQPYTFIPAAASIL